MNNESLHENGGFCFVSEQRRSYGHHRCACLPAKAGHSLHRHTFIHLLLCNRLCNRSCSGLCIRLKNRLSRNYISNFKIFLINIIYCIIFYVSSPCGGDRGGWTFFSVSCSPIKNYGRKRNYRRQ
jgi:hypothetical protein